MPVGKKSIARMAGTAQKMPEENAGIHVEAPEVPKGTPAVQPKKAPTAKKKAPSASPKATAANQKAASPKAIAPTMTAAVGQDSYPVGKELPYWLL